MILFLVLIFFGEGGDGEEEDGGAFKRDVGEDGGVRFLGALEWQQQQLGCQFEEDGNSRNGETTTGKILNS